MVCGQEAQVEVRPGACGSRGCPHRGAWAGMWGWDFIQYPLVGKEVGGGFEDGSVTVHVRHRGPAEYSHGQPNPGPVLGSLPCWDSGEEKSWGRGNHAKALRQK